MPILNISTPLTKNHVYLESLQVKLICLLKTDLRMAPFPFILMGEHSETIDQLCSLHSHGPVASDPVRRETYTKLLVWHLMPQEGSTPETIPAQCHMGAQHS